MSVREDTDISTEWKLWNAVKWSAVEQGMPIHAHCYKHCQLNYEGILIMLLCRHAWLPQTVVQQKVQRLLSQGQSLTFASASAICGGPPCSPEGSYVPRPAALLVDIHDASNFPSIGEYLSVSREFFFNQRSGIFINLKESSLLYSFCPLSFF